MILKVISRWPNAWGDLIDAHCGRKPQTTIDAIVPDPIEMAIRDNLLSESDTANWRQPTPVHCLRCCFGRQDASRSAKSGLGVPAMLTERIVGGGHRRYKEGVNRSLLEMATWTRHP